MSRLGLEVRWEIYDMPGVCNAGGATQVLRTTICTSHEEFTFNSYVKVRLKMNREAEG